MGDRADRELAEGSLLIFVKFSLAGDELEGGFALADTIEEEWDASGASPEGLSTMAKLDVVFCVEVVHKSLTQEC